MMRNLIIGVVIGAIALGFQTEPTYAEAPGTKVLVERLFETAQQAVNDGYTPITFTEFKVSEKSLAATGTPIMLPVGLFHFNIANKGGTIRPVQINAAGTGFTVDVNDSKEIDVLVDDAEPTTKQALIDTRFCAQNYGGCWTILLGYAVECTVTNMYGTISNRICLNVTKSYSPQEMVEGARIANAAPPPVAYQPSLRTAIQPAAPSGLGPSFDRGHQDRMAWETWHAALSSDYRTGSEYWAGQRSMANPGSCSGEPEFTAGCLAAKKFLDPIDAQRKTDPTYKAGWNTYP
jgi:hypothetical protein